MTDLNTQEKKEVEDIFANFDQPVATVNENLKQEPAKTADSVLSSNQTSPVGVPSSKSSLTWVYILLAIILILLITVGIYYFFIKEKPSQAVIPNEVEQTAGNIIPETNPNIEQPESNIVETKTRQDIDSDYDGLIDSEELRLHTGVNNPDTDKDGLFDGEEVNFYNTNPLEADTDGDGYLDGEEVASGYNPNGDGKLLNFEQAKQNINK